MIDKNTKLGDSADVYGVFTYQDDLIKHNIEAFENWRHREAAVRKDHFLNAYITKLDEETFSEKPITDPDIFAIAGIEADWNREQWNQLFIKMFDKARTHRYCVVQLYNKEPWWRVFYERQIKEFKVDNSGKITGCIVQWSLDIPKSDTYLNFEEDIDFYPNGSGTLVTFGRADDTDGTEAFGKNDLEQVWSLDVYIRYAIWDIVVNSALAGGLWHLTYGDSIDEGTRQDLVNLLAVGSRAIGAKETVLKELSSKYPSKPEFTIDALVQFAKQFAGATRLPLLFYQGESDKKGLFDNQAMPQIQINKKKRFIFNQFSEDMMRLIQMRWGVQLNEIYPNIEELEDEHYKEDITVEVPQDNKKQDFEEQEKDTEDEQEDMEEINKEEQENGKSE